MAKESSAYIPGVCNINKDEIAYRQKAGYLGLGLAIVILLALFIFKAPQWSRIIVFLPLLVGVLGFLQAKNKFCVAYGAAGKQNATDGSATASEITEADAKLKDKQKARKINIQAALISVIATVAVCLIPNF